MRCKPIHPTPCHRYDPDDQPGLIQFLRENGCDLHHVEQSGIAQLKTLVDGETRLIYVKPGYWLRVIKTGMLWACSDAQFWANYELVGEVLTNHTTNYTPQLTIAPETRHGQLRAENAGTKREINANPVDGFIDRMRKRGKVSSRKKGQKSNVK